MGRIQKTQRLLAIFLFVALVIPLLAVGSYASQKVSYDFYFNENKTTQPGIKDDVGDPTGGVAGVSITRYDFALGNVRFYLRGPDGAVVSDTSGRITTPQNSLALRYNSGAYLYDNCVVTLVGIREGNTVHVGGNFHLKLEAPDVPAPAGGDIL